MEDLFRVSRLELRTDDTLYVDAHRASSFMEWLIEAIGATRVAHAPQEVAWVVTLDSHARVYTLVEVGRGTPRSIHLHIPTMLQAVLTAGAERFMYIHSHPSGSPTPTVEDIDVTEIIANAAAMCGIRLEDSLVITRDPKQYTSMANVGLFVPSEYTDGTTDLPAGELATIPGRTGDPADQSTRLEVPDEEGAGAVCG